jgi:hypothetical protein
MEKLSFEVHIQQFWQIVFKLHEELEEFLFSIVPERQTRRRIIKLD